MSCQCINNQAIDIIGLCQASKIELKDADSWTKLSIPEVLRIPCSKPDIESIEKVFINVDIISKRVVATPAPAVATVENQEGTKLTGRKLIVEGILEQNIVYTADVPVQSVHSAHFCVPFSAFIVLPKDAVLDDMDPNYCVKTCIEDVYVTVFNKREIFKNVTLFLKAIKKSDAETGCP